MQTDDSHKAKFTHSLSIDTPLFPPFLPSRSEIYSSTHLPAFFRPSLNYFSTIFRIIFQISFDVNRAPWQSLDLRTAFPLLLLLPPFDQGLSQSFAKSERQRDWDGVAYLTVQLKATVSYVPSVFGRCKP